MSEPWPEHLDALQASAEHHTLLFENEHVRVLQTRIPAGEHDIVALTVEGVEGGGA